MEAIDGKTLNRDGWLARLLLNILQSFIIIDAEEMEDTKNRSLAFLGYLM